MKRFLVSHSLLVACGLLLALLLPTSLYLTSVPVWDDATLFANYAGRPLSAALGPFLINDASSYWRPLTALTMVIPLHAGVPLWTAKALNLALFYLFGCLTLRCLARLTLAQDGSTPNAPLAPLIIVAALLALHPVYVESILWIAARADLLLGIFVMIAIDRILLIWRRDGDGRASRWEDGMAMFIVCWLACASKDTGVAWAVIGLLVTLWMAHRQQPRNKVFWHASAAGLGAALLSYLLVRSMVMAPVAGAAHQLTWQHPDWSSGLRNFDEFMARSVTSTVLPLLDQSPYKATGWMEPYGTAQLVLLAVLLIGAAMLGSWRLAQRRPAAGLLFAVSSVMVGAHALVNVVAQPTFGSAMSPRYISPSFTLMIMAAVMCWRSTTGGDGWRQLLRTNGWLVAVTVLILAQSLQVWNVARSAWQSDLDLWRSAWNAGARNKLVVTNLSGALLDAGDPRTARQLASAWIAAHDEPGERRCKLYSTALSANIALNDNASGIALAQKAAPTAWCDPNLAHNITVYLLPDHCGQTLPMLDATLDEPAMPPDRRLWQFSNAQERLGVVLLAAVAQARCGTDARLSELLQEAQAIDPSWATGGTKAAELIRSARQ